MYADDSMEDAQYQEAVKRLEAAEQELSEARVELESAARRYLLAAVGNDADAAEAEGGWSGGGVLMARKTLAYFINGDLAGEERWIEGEHLRVVRLAGANRERLDWLRADLKNEAVMEAIVNSVGRLYLPIEKVADDLAVMKDGEDIVTPAQYDAAIKWLLGKIHTRGLEARRVAYDLETKATVAEAERPFW